MVIGIWKKTILLPKREYSYKELYYVLLHEYTHILNKDLFVKWFVQISCIVFWWNPILHILKSEISQILEIKCDVAVTRRLTVQGTKEYLQTIIDMLRTSSNQGKKRNYNVYETAALIQSPQEEVVERFHMILNNLEKKKGYANQIYVGMFLLLFVFSYSVIPQPSYETEMEQELFEETLKEEDAYLLTPENSYIIKDTEGRYHWIREEIMDDIISKEERDQLIQEGFPERQ